MSLARKSWPRSLVVKYLSSMSKLAPVIQGGEQRERVSLFEIGPRSDLRADHHDATWVFYGVLYLEGREKKDEEKQR